MIKIYYMKDRLTKIMLDPYLRNVVGEIEDKINN